MTYQTCGEKPRRIRNVWHAAASPNPPKQPSVWNTTEWTEMQDLITAALKPHAQAWDAVAQALEEHHFKYANRTG